MLDTSTIQLHKYKLNKDNRHSNMDSGQLRRPQPHTENYMQLENAEMGESVFSQRREHQLVNLYKIALK